MIGKVSPVILTVKYEPKPCSTSSGPNSERTNRHALPTPEAHCGFRFVRRDSFEHALVKEF